VHSLSAKLLIWYQKQGRKFSFRKATDPYQILVSEILLRQTTAKQVDKVFPKLIKRYPSVNDMANAKTENLKVILRPLGIISRAEQLIEISRQIVTSYGGSVPRDMRSLLRLKGVGPYIAGCVLSFAYGHFLPLIDSNVSRVLSRVFSLNQRDIRSLEMAYISIAPKGQARYFHYALLDLAALVCRPEKPNCNNCPIQDECMFFKKLYRGK